MLRHLVTGAISAVMVSVTRYIYEGGESEFDLLIYFVVQWTFLLVVSRGENDARTL